MLPRRPASRRLRYLLCSLLIASCGSPPARVPDKISTDNEAASIDVRALENVYVERLRLGLGSPYRLMEMALRDERLGARRGEVARALLARIERGDMYEVSALALVAAGVPEPSAIAQRELIEDAITRARDPRVGELGVTLAYELAAAEQTVTPAVVARVTRIAALLRDRALARADAQRLRAGARRAAVAPENLVLAWRNERKFAVEQPTLAVLDPVAQEDAAQLALLLVGGIRAAAAPVTSTLQRTIAADTSGLGAAPAEEAGGRSDQNALVITLRAILAGAQGSNAAVNAANWQSFFRAATDEESFAIELGRARRSQWDDVVAAGITLDVATALRAFAQEPIQRMATSAADLKTRFGVRVRFNARIRPDERSRTLQVLANALEDMRRVVRGGDFTGLRLDIGPIPANAPHLAFHDPRTRVIRLDPSIMAGTIAHELGHDIDWQLAARKYRKRSNYATDYATETRRALAYSVESMVPAAPMSRLAQDDAAARRPAEIFARRFEWYVADALAQQGRSNGYLSSVQNDWIAGYGSAVRPDPSPSSAKAFAAFLAEAISLDRAERSRVERIVMQSAPAAVRVLSRVSATTDEVQFQQTALNELAAWQCSNSWQVSPARAGALKWFAEALAEARFKHAEMISPLLVQPVHELSGLVPACAPANGAFLAGSTR